MAKLKIQTQAPASDTSELLPDGEYILTIDDAKIEEDQFAKPNKDGSQPEKLVVTWLLEDGDVTPKMRKRGVKAGRKIWSRYGLFYYTKADGSDTALKMFLDAIDGQLNAEGVAFSVDDLEGLYDEPGILVGIKARCLVEVYTKTKGARAGEKDNRVLKVLPAEDEDDEAEEAEEPAPPPQPVARPRGAVPARNRPQPATDDGIPF